MQTTIPNRFIGCQFNLSAIPAMLKLFGLKLFVTVPDRVRGETVNADKKEASVWFGAVQDVECFADGTMRVKDEFVSDTVVLLEGFIVENLLEIMADFLGKFEPIQVRNMTVWLPKKNG